MTKSDRREAAIAMAKVMVNLMADEGTVIGGGYLAAVQVMRWNELPEDQQKALRLAFWLGAQHLFGSMMNLFEPGAEEPTEKDLQRMAIIADELEKFTREMMNVILTQ